MNLDQFRTAEDIRAELSDALDGYDMANAFDDLYYLLGEVERLQAVLTKIAVSEFQDTHAIAAREALGTGRNQHGSSG